MSIDFTVNGESFSLPEIPGEKLSDLLRRRLNLTGTKVGCGEGRCGICTVLVGGKPARSCLTPAAKVAGKSIVTIEGLRQIAKQLNRPIRPQDANEARGAFGENLHTLHPLQEAFIRFGAIQCGFCTPGQIMRAYALLEANPDPSSEEIRAAMNDVLCRCGSYQLIEGAIKAAAKSLKTGRPVENPVLPESPKSENLYEHVGQMAIRPDAVAKACGSARFTDDLSFKGMLYARVKRAGVPSAILSKLDISAALALPGVHAVLTAADLPAAKFHGVHKTDWPILVGIGERVRYQGDAIALVAAESQAIADKAVDLISVSFEPHPVYASPKEALAADAESLHPDGNLLKQIRISKGSSAAAFAKADLVIEAEYRTPFADHFFMEPECSIAVPLFADNSPGPGKIVKMDLYVGSQIPYGDRQQIAQALGFPEEQVRVRGQRTGGGFGGKEDIAGQIHAALLAQATHRAVKLLFTRRESLLVHPKRHATELHTRLGALRNGALVAAETELYGDTGAYASLGEHVMTRATTHASGPYAIPNLLANCYATYTNNPPAGAFRGFGVMQAAFSIESTMDTLAHRLKMDPIELRLKNALRPGLETNTGQILDRSVGLVPCLESIQAELKHLIPDRDPFRPVHYSENGRDYVKAWGVAAAYKNTGLGSGAHDFAGAEVKLLPNGRVQVSSAAAELGQGLVAALQIIAAEILHLPLFMINVFLMDTDLTLDAGPTTASRQTFVTGNAVRQAALQLRERLFAKAAKHWSLPENETSLSELTIDQAGIHSPQRDLLTLAELFDLLSPEERSSKYVYTAPETEPIDHGKKIHFAFSFATQAVELRVDKATGEMKVLRVLTANDSGRVINPLGFEAQAQGGVVMGVGTALLEEFAVKEGIVLSDRIARYPVPRMQDTPEMHNLIVESPCADGPFGAKGIGEIVSIPTAPAVANALFNATGVRITHLPIRPIDLADWVKENQ